MNKSDAETLWGLLSQSRGIAIDADLNEEVGPSRLSSSSSPLNWNYQFTTVIL